MPETTTIPRWLTTRRQTPRSLQLSDGRYLRRDALKHDHTTHVATTPRRWAFGRSDRGTTT